MSHLRSWWYQLPEAHNFGDELGHTFLTLLGHEIERVPFSEADILTTGSILQHRAPLKPGTILWGTGWHKRPPQHLPKLDVRMVRGQLTADIIKAKVPYGDPGFLASHFWPATEPRQGMGFVRHYADHTNIPGVKLIDPLNDPETVCRQIASCETIISSSLHGCIVAASYGIPYMRLPHTRVIGGDTKWIDFTTSLNRPIEAIQHDLIERIADL